MREKKPKFTKQIRSYSYYSGIALEMGVIIAGGTYGGLKLDEFLNLKPLFTILGALLSIAIAMYIIIKDLSINKNNKNGKNPN
jgi:F0F1-type ATP synthase assembly protein I